MLVAAVAEQVVQIQMAERLQLEVAPEALEQLDQEHLVAIIPAAEVAEPEVLLRMLLVVREVKVS